MILKLRNYEDYMGVFAKKLEKLYTELHKEDTERHEEIGLTNFPLQKHSSPSYPETFDC